MMKWSTNLNSALHKEDIEGLVASGAPANEYSTEAQEIAKALSALRPDQISEATIVAILALVWANNFNRSPQEIEQRMPAFRRIAGQILS